MKEIIKDILLAPVYFYVFAILWLFGDVEIKDFANHFNDEHYDD